MGPGADAPGSTSTPELSSPSPASADAAPPPSENTPQQIPPSPSLSPSLQAAPAPGRYGSQKRRDWQTFLQYLKSRKPPLTLARCSGTNVVEFLKYLDKFGKTKVHDEGCAHFGRSQPAPCACPLKQAWGSLDALIGRLRAAYDESGGKPEVSPLGSSAVRVYLREVRESQAKARGIPYERKKRKRSANPQVTSTTEATGSSSSASAAADVPDRSEGAEADGGTRGGNGERSSSPAASCDRSRTLHPPSPPSSSSS